MRQDLWNLVEPKKVERGNEFKFSGEPMNRYEINTAENIYSLLESIEASCGGDVLKRLTYLTGTDIQGLEVLKAILEAKYKPYTSIYKFVFEKEYDTKYNTMNKVITSYRKLDESLKETMKSTGFVEEVYDFPRNPGLFMISNTGEWVNIGISGLMVQKDTEEFVFDYDKQHQYVYVSLRHEVTSEMIDAFNDRRLMMQLA